MAGVHVSMPAISGFGGRGPARRTRIGARGTGGPSALRFTLLRVPRGVVPLVLEFSGTSGVRAAAASAFAGCAQILEACYRWSVNKPGSRTPRRFERFRPRATTNLDGAVVCLRSYGHRSSSFSRARAYRRIRVRSSLGRGNGRLISFYRWWMRMFDEV